MSARILLGGLSGNLCSLTATDNQHLNRLLGQALCHPPPLISAAGQATATLDWCEENYTVWYFIAEFCTPIASVYCLCTTGNTLSNIIYVWLGIQSAIRSWNLSHEKRFPITYLLLAIIGVGSTAFHGTLLFETQMVLLLLLVGYFG